MIIYDFSSSPPNTDFRARYDIFYVSITNTFGYYKQARKLIYLFVIAQKIDCGWRGEGTVWTPCGMYCIITPA